MQDISENIAHGATTLPKANDLEKHCLTCRRRRVKCDATHPTCRRCQADDINCRGYKQQLKIIPFHPTSSSKLTARHYTNEPEEKKSEAKPFPIFPLPQDGEELVIVDAIRSYNKHVVRHVSPAHHPFRRKEIPEGIDWYIMPKALRHILVVTTRSSRAIKDGIDPISRQDICHYRGLSLHELKQHLPDAAKDYYGLALGCIILLMAADMHPSAEGSWSWHFQAARRIIELRGGLNACLHNIPNLEVPLLNYMIVDILTATACRSALLFPDGTSMKAHSRYLPVLTEWQEDIMASSYPCPHVILQFIVRTNILRSSRQAWRVSREPATSFHEQLFLNEFSELLAALEAFDVRAWTSEVLSRGQILPQQVEDCPSSADVYAFTSLTLCFKSAALIYLVLSSAHSYSEPLLEVARFAKQVVDEQSSLLLTAADRNDEDGKLHTQLWKFLTWPLVISVYAQVGWGIGLEIESADAELDRLEKTARDFGLGRLLTAIKQMRKIRVQRRSHTQHLWTWDDGFSSRATFAL